MFLFFFIIWLISHATYNTCIVKPRMEFTKRLTYISDELNSSIPFHFIAARYARMYRRIPGTRNLEPYYKDYASPARVTEALTFLTGNLKYTTKCGQYHYVVIGDDPPVSFIIIKSFHFKTNHTNT